MVSARLHAARLQQLLHHRRRLKVAPPVLDELHLVEQVLEVRGRALLLLAKVSRAVAAVLLHHADDVAAVELAPALLRHGIAPRAALAGHQSSSA